MFNFFKQVEDEAEKVLDHKSLYMHLMHMHSLLVFGEADKAVQHLHGIMDHVGGEEMSELTAHAKDMMTKTKAAAKKVEEQGQSIEAQAMQAINIHQ